MTNSGVSVHLALLVLCSCVWRYAPPLVCTYFLPGHPLHPALSPSPHSHAFELCAGPDFPAAPPKGYFITPLFHPNVSKAGDICVNTLKKDWQSGCTLRHILVVCIDREQQGFLCAR